MNEDTEQSQSKKPEQSAAEQAAAEPTSSEQPASEPTETERLAHELADYKDRLMRAAAELDNMRRRFEREKSDLLKFGQEKLFLDFDMSQAHFFDPETEAALV